MTTYLTIWHYTVIILTTVIFFVLVYIAFKEERSSVRNAMIFSSLLVMTLVSGFLILALDKYTKKVTLAGLKNHRQLSTERITYTGYVKNTGDYTVGTVKIEFKIVNKGHVTGNVKGGSFFRPSGMSDFFGGGDKKAYRPQKIEETVIVAEDLAPGKSKYFNVRFDYPPYFKQVSHFQRVFAH